jgi:hypothetical protein
MMELERENDVTCYIIPKGEPNAVNGEKYEM